MVKNSTYKASDYWVICYMHYLRTCRLKHMNKCMKNNKNHSVDDNTNDNDGE